MARMTKTQRRSKLIAIQNKAFDLLQDGVMARGFEKTITIKDFEVIERIITRCLKKMG